MADVARALDNLEIEYAVTGGMAVVVWGRPRFTHDVDMVVALSEGQVQGLADALRALNPAGYVDEEMMKDAVAHSGEFNFIDPETSVKVDFWVGRGDAFDASFRKRRIAKTIQGTTVYFASPEDLILSKLLWFKQTQSTRQLEDIESILSISGDVLDHAYISEWTARLGVVETWESILKRT